MNNYKILMTCLFEIQLLETLWAYYTYGISSQFDKECRKMALRFISSYKKIVSIDSKYNNKDDLEIINILNEWANGTKYYPYSSLMESNINLLPLFYSLKDNLLRDLKLPHDYEFILLLEERRYYDQFIRWKGHIPSTLLEKIDKPGEIVSQASLSQSIALIGDIRRSQDLMTYSTDPDDYSDKMEQFITTTRKLIDKNYGFFDKFTGDGFIVYFNEVMCNHTNLSFIDCFINFIRDEMKFAIPFFENWERSIRRRPTIKIGLALGADVGKIEFKDIKNHLIAVGDAIVWGTRMASSSLANEILVNNLLYSLLIARQDVSLQEHKGKTKSGEKFLAYKLKIIENVA